MAHGVLSLGLRRQCLVRVFSTRENVRQSKMCRGILSTLSGAIVAKVRADGEPEKSLLLTHGLDLFIRRCEDLITDSGQEDGKNFDDKIKELRHDYEQMMQKAPNTYACSVHFSLPESDRLLVPVLLAP